MTYIDTSCLLKVFRDEPLSAAVHKAVMAESQVAVSALTEMEALVQLKAFWAGGGFTQPQWRKVEAELAQLRNQEPFKFYPMPVNLFQTAMRQHRNAGGTHCRTLDRLHLAAMEELGISRLMTHDHGQAQAALAAGFAVVRPGMD